MGATVSIGAACAETAMCDIDQLLLRADAALYTAKENGRNRVVCAPDEAFPAIAKGRAARSSDRAAVRAPWATLGPQAA
jgi:predicted signal transduction protein with EAL and GGDEF domain